MSDELTDAEYEEAKTNLKALQEAYAKDPVATTQALKDAVQLPRKSGDLSK